MTPVRLEQRVADLLAFLFTMVILIYAASGPLSEGVRWIIEATTPGFDELSRRQQRLLMREHWLGGAFRSFERTFLLPTGLILGLPILFSFAISFLNLSGTRAWAKWALAALSTVVFCIWVANLYAVDGGALPSAQPFDFVLFPIATVLVLYLTWRGFGGFIVGFCLFWITYFFVRGWLPDWTGILAGSDATLAQSMRSMVLNFWSQTGGMFGQPLQVVSGNVLIFIVFGAVLMASGAGDLLMKIANRLTGGLTGGAAHAAVASSALFGTLSGAAISNVVSTGVMTIPVIKRSGFRPAFAAAVEAAASTGGQVMPPVMGVVAFFVAGQIGREYRYIVIAALIPAVFFYLGTFLTVYFEARRQGVGPLPAEERPKLTGAERVQCLVFVLPLGVLSYFLFAQLSVPKAGFFGFIVALASALVLFRSFRSPARLYTAFVNAGRMSASIIIIVTAIGLIVGLLQVSGFSGRLSRLLCRDFDRHTTGRAGRLCGSADCRSGSRAYGVSGGAPGAGRLHHSLRLRLPSGRSLQAAGAVRLVRRRGAGIQGNDRHRDSQLVRSRLDHGGLRAVHVAFDLCAHRVRKEQAQRNRTYPEGRGGGRAPCPGPVDCRTGAGRRDRACRWAQVPGRRTVTGRCKIGVNRKETAFFREEIACGNWH